MNVKADIDALFRHAKNSGAFTDFLRLINTEEKAAIFFEHVGILSLTRGECVCGNQGLLKLKRSSLKFGFRWGCYAMAHQGVRYIHPLGKTKFFHSRISLMKIMDIMLNWFFRSSFEQTLSNTKCSSQTISRWFKRFKEVCVHANERDYKIGGPGHWVELDETHLFRRKYHVGHHIVGESIWIFGGVDRTTKKRFIVRVPNRKKRTLWPLIERFVEKDSILVTDDFTSYRGIETKGYASHEVVVHRENFRHPQFPDVYTNGVECVWSKLKRHVKRSGTDDYVDTTIEEFLYRHKLQLKYGRRHYGVKFKQFCEDLKRVNLDNE